MRWLLILSIQVAWHVFAGTGPSSSVRVEGAAARQVGPERWAEILERSRLHGDESALRELKADVEDEQRRPYLSFVTILRNDDYGGRLLERFAAYLSAIAVHTSAISPVRAEVIIVEWDPPQERGGLREAVAWPELLQDVTLITVPGPEISRVGCKGLQYELQNLGVGVARGDFIFVNNADVVLSGELMAELARGQLNADCFYRADRADTIGLHPLPITSARASMEELRSSFLSSQVSLDSHTVRRITSWGLLWTPLPDSETPQVEGRDKLEAYHRSRHESDTVRRGTPVSNMGELHYSAAGDFTGMSKEAWSHVGGFDRDSFCESRCDNHTDSYLLVKASLMGLRQVYLKPPSLVYHQEHTRNRQNADCDHGSWPAFQAHASQVFSSPKPWSEQFELGASAKMQVHGTKGRGGAKGRAGAWREGGALGYGLLRWSPISEALSDERGDGIPGRGDSGAVHAKTEDDDTHGDVAGGGNGDDVTGLCGGGWIHLREPWAALTFLGLAANKASQTRGYAVAEACYLASIHSVAGVFPALGTMAAAVEQALSNKEGWGAWGFSAMTKVGAWLSSGFHGSPGDGEALHKILHVLSSASLSAGNSGNEHASRVWAAAAHAVAVGENTQSKAV